MKTAVFFLTMCLAVSLVAAPVQPSRTDAKPDYSAQKLAAGADSGTVTPGSVLNAIADLGTNGNLAVPFAAAVPEPSTVGLLVLGSAALGLLRRRRA